MAHALNVFDDQEAARRWLHTQSRALGGVVPLLMLDTDAGACLVDDELTRIEYGVFA